MSSGEVEYQLYAGEHQLDEIAKLIESELSEPYSFYIYRLFVINFPHLCYLAICDNKIVGVVLSKLDNLDAHGTSTCGYVGMLVVDENYRGKRIGTTLVRLTCRAIRDSDALYACVETESNNLTALTLYENLGFIRTNLLPSYYLNDSDAYRLKFWYKEQSVDQVDIDIDH